MFDAILYINLEYRKDRKDHILKELEKINNITTNIYRIDAVLEKYCGHLGCGKSHIKALELAIKNNWDSVLIVEDDMAFVEDLSKLQLIENIEWDVMMLGYGHHYLEDCDYPFLKKVIAASCTHAYIVKKHYYQKLLDNFKKAVSKMTDELESHFKTYPFEKLHYCSAIDQSWRSLQEKDTFYTFEPNISVQLRQLISDNNCSLTHQENAINLFYTNIC